MPLNAQSQTNYISKDFQYLRVRPDTMKTLRKNYSQVWQDIFALVVNDAKMDGTFIEVGGGQPKVGNNTWLLEEAYNWRGFSIELDHKLAEMWAPGERPNTKMFMADALNFDFVKAVDDLDLPRHLDYLSFDLEPPELTLELIKKFPLDELSFNCITYEHDVYRMWGTVDEMYEHRDYFEKHGYDLVGDNLMNQNCAMEEWFIHESVDQSIRDALRGSLVEAYELLLDL